MTSTRKPKRRDLILDQALILFNEIGSGQVTTNHIAEAMGISPGNLYYHYHSKEHIIRELFQRLIKAFDALVPPPMDTTPFPQFISKTLDAFGRLIYTYRFIYLELAVLLARDLQFAEMYRQIKTKRVQDFLEFFNALDQRGLLGQNITVQEQETLMFIIWTYAEGIITALHSSNIQVTPEAIQANFKKIVIILKPYLAPGQWSALSGQLDLP